ncbi:MAG: hypothetical protein II644_06515 [Paludibacteraceae bacterium]|nr:hypothetical protein [Paludibacteraceae bacterium]
MRKSFFFALALVAGALAFTSCEGNDPKQQYPASVYDGIWVSDSLFTDNGEKTNDALMWEILNSEQIVFHSGDTAKWEVHDDHFFTFTFRDGVQIEMEAMDGDEEKQRVSFYVWGENLDRMGIWNPEISGLYMYRLPKPEGNKLPVTEANLLGKWRTTYEINSSYDTEGNKNGETKFYHGYEIWDIQANGVATSYSDPYSYDGWWALDGDKLALYTGHKPADLKPDYFRNVELYSNFMHIIHYTYREDGTLYNSNQQFLYRVK